MGSLYHGLDERRVKKRVNLIEFPLQFIELSVRPFLRRSQSLDGPFGFCIEF